jgi:hypothetical protein
MGARGQVTTATEKLRDAVRARGWSEEELAWVLDLPVELAEHLMWEVDITPMLALRLEAALEIPAGDWYAAARMPMPICGCWPTRWPACWPESAGDDTVSATIEGKAAAEHSRLERARIKPQPPRSNPRGLQNLHA